MAEWQYDEVGVKYDDVGRGYDFILASIVDDVIDWIRRKRRRK